MFVNIDDFNIQVNYFLKHLGGDYVVGFIVDSAKKGKLERKSWLVSLEPGIKPEDITLTQSQSLYFLPQVSDGLGRKDENITNIRTLLIDIDELEKDIDFGGFLPNIYIKRTDNRAIQAYYFLDQDITPVEFVAHQKALEDKFSNEKITSISHGGRICGVRRGDKKKDIEHKIEKNLTYALISHHEKKYSKEDLQKFLGSTTNKSLIEMPAKFSKPTLSSLLTAVDDDTIFFPFEKDFNARFFHFKDSEGIKSIETIKKERTNTLYRFACCLIDKKLDILRFKDFCDRNGIPACKISGCDNDEFEKIYHDSLKYAKSLKEKREQTARNEEPTSEVGITLEELYTSYKSLHFVKNEMNSYIFVEDEDSFYREEVGGKLTKINKNTFNAKFKTFTSVTKADGKTVPTQPVSLFLSKLTSHHFKVVASTTYIPHASRIQYRGRLLLNTWYYPDLLTEKLGDLTLFLEHIRWMFEGQKSLDGLDLGEFFLDYLAYVYCNQNPAKFSWLLYARNMGIGRSFFSGLLAELMGRDNVSVPTPEIANEKYTGWYSTKQFAIVEELVEDLGFYERLKPIIANELVSHREMHQNSTMSDNYCNILLLSNKIDCLKVVEGDRRLLIVHMHQPVQPTPYYDALYAWKKIPENIYALSQFLIARNKKVDVKRMLGHAPLTTAKSIMQQVSRDTPSREIQAHVDEKSFGRDGEFVCRDTLMKSLYPNVDLNDAVRQYNTHVSKKLLSNGYVPVLYSKQKRLVEGQNPVRLTIYVKSHLAEKYLKNEDEVVNEYKIYKGILKREPEPVIIDKEMALISLTTKEPAIIDSEMSLEKISAQEPSPIIDNQDLSDKPVKQDVKKKSGKEKINALVLEARRRAESVVETVAVTVEDLLRIREERCSQEVDVSCLYK